MSQKCKSLFPPGQSIVPSYFVIYVPFQAGTNAPSSFLHELLTILTLPACPPETKNEQLQDNSLYLYISVVTARLSMLGLGSATRVPEVGCIARYPPCPTESIFGIPPQYGVIGLPLAQSKPPYPGITPYGVQ